MKCVVTDDVFVVLMLVVVWLRSSVGMTGAVSVGGMSVAHSI